MQRLGEEQALRVYNEALEKATQEQKRQLDLLLQPLQTPAQGSSDSSSSSTEQGSTSASVVGDGTEDAPAPLPGWQRLHVHARGRVDGVLMSAFDHVIAALNRSSSSSSSSSEDGSGREGEASTTSQEESSRSRVYTDAGMSSETAVAARCWELLCGMATPLLQDLWVLREDARLRQDEQGAHRLESLFMEQVRGNEREQGVPRRSEAVHVL